MRTLLFCLLSCCSALLGAEELLVQPWVHTTEYSRSEAPVSEYLLGVGAYQKIGGRWRHKRSETLSGELLRVTWQVNEGFTAEEGYQWLRQQLTTAELLFECNGRACGSSAQWANRVFGERVLYGHDERQLYGVWRLQQAGTTWTVVMYGVDRANRRHFLHVDQLRHAAEQPAELP